MGVLRSEVGADDVGSRGVDGEKHPLGVQHDGGLDPEALDRGRQPVLGHPAAPEEVGRRLLLCGGPLADVGAQELRREGVQLAEAAL